MSDAETSTLTRPGAPELYLRRWARSDADYALLLVHGTAGHGGCYDEFAAAARERGADVWSFDLRGHGRSGGPRGVFTMEGFLDDVDAVARVATETTGLPIVLLGASQGGEVAFHSLAHSGAVTAAVCMNILLASELPMNARIRFMQGPAAGRLASLVGDRMKIPLPRVIDFSAAYREDPTLLPEKRADPLYVWRYGLASYRSVFTYRPPRPASANDKPVLVAVGEDDPVVGADHCRACFERIGGPKSFFALPRGGHQLMQFHRERFADVVDHWVRHAVLAGRENWKAPPDTYGQYLDEQASSAPESGYRPSTLHRALARVANGRVDRGVEFFRHAGPTERGRFVSAVVAQIDSAAWPTLAPFLPAESKGRLAVLGCGDGRVVQALCAAEPRLADWEIVGVDIDADAIARARREHADLAQWRVLDARRLGAQVPDHFDAIYAHGIFDHCAGHETLLRSCRDALRPGGVFMYVTPDRNLSTWLQFVAIGPRFVFRLGHQSDLHDFLRFPRAPELDALATRVGLQVEEDPDEPGRAYHRGIDYRAGPLAIAQAVQQRDLSTLGFRVTRPRWWLGGGFSGEYIGVMRRPAAPAAAKASGSVQD